MHSAKRDLCRLTKQEITVLRLIANGSSNKEIAQQLVNSLGTIETHVSHILSKLNVANRVAAVAWLWQHKDELEVLSWIVCPRNQSFHCFSKAYYGLATLVPPLLVVLPAPATGMVIGDYGRRRG